jgi:hypothetical protein
MSFNGPVIVIASFTKYFCLLLLLLLMKGMARNK